MPHLNKRGAWPAGLKFDMLDVHIKDSCQPICSVAVTDVDSYLANYLRNTPAMVYTLLIMTEVASSCLIITKI